MMYNTNMRLFAVLDSQQTEIALIIIASLALGSLIFLCLFFGLTKKHEVSHEKEIKDMSNSIRVYVVDIKNDTVKYFNSAHLRERKTSSLATFYNQYRSKQREELVSWIGELLETKATTPKCLEINVYITSDRRNASSILEVQKIDAEKQIVYLESYILQSNFSTKKKEEIAHFTKLDYLMKKILVSNGKGTSFVFNFFNTVTKASDITQLAYADIRDIVLGFSSDNVLITEKDYGLILITNLSVKGKTDAISFINQIKAKLNRFLLIKSYSNDIDYSIGVIDNGENFRDVNALIKNVIAVSEIAKNETERLLFFSDIKTIITEEQGNQYRSDVQTVIQENKLRYLFQPICNVKRNRIAAYRVSVEPYDCLFKDIYSLKNYAMRTEDDKELFSNIAKNVISRFVQERNDHNVMLFFEISFNEIGFVSKFLSHTPYVNDANIVLVLKESELSALPDEYEEEQLIDGIRSFKSKGYSVALEIEDDVLTLSPSVYSVFDFFNLSVSSHISKKDTGKNLPTFEGLIEKLLHYDKPLVAYNVQSWDIVELVYKLGIQNICSDAISMPSENIMPIQKKIITKIQNLKS